MIYYDSEYATIQYFEKEKMLFTRYHGFTPSEELRKIMDLVLELITSREVELSLSDNRNMKVIRPADQEYINTVWFPKFLKVSRIRKAASIESTDIFNKMSRENILKKIEGQIPFEIHYFDSIESACEWLGVDPQIIAA
ncbi:MAG TPA: hypothetical protein VK927_11910 [Adhaeribacter sp.]|nr:hypothetical protein [Adhaeribacter sp.]